MIKSFTVFAADKLPLSEKHLKDTPWLTKLTGDTKHLGKIVFICGPNGSGKSALLSVIAKYFHCYQGGIPKVTQSSVWEISPPNFFQEKSKFHYGMSFVQDGSPVFYCSGKSYENDYADDFYAEKIQKNFAKGSSGEGNIQDFIQLFKDAKKIKGPLLPDTSRMSREAVRKMETSLFAYENPYTLEKECPTIILDEAESNLDIENQAYFFKMLFGQVSNWAQIIFTSHSPLVYPLLPEDATIIETKRGYFNKTTKGVAKIFTDFYGKPRKKTQWVYKRRGDIGTEYVTVFISNGFTKDSRGVTYTSPSAARAQLAVEGFSLKS